MKTKGIMIFVAGLLAAAMTQATIIYQDTFSTDGQLSGRAVETGTGNWIAYSTLITTNGTALPGETVNGKGAVLAFTPQSGMVYTLSADVSAISGGSTYIGVGFVANSVVPNGSEFFANLVDTAAPWAYVVTNGTFATLLGPGGGGYAGFSGKGATGTIKVVLDTTGTDWVSTWYYNNAALRTNTYSGALTGINYVGFGTGGSLNATVDNFTLDAIPEPATLGLFGAVGAVLFLVRRRMIK